MKIKQIPIEERPRERLIKYGVDRLSNEELLAIIIRTGTKNKSARDIALSIIESIEGLNNLKDITVNKLLEIDGIGKVKAIELVTVIEIGRRVYLEVELSLKKKLTSPKEIYDNSKYLFKDKKQECFYCLYFNNKQTLIERRLLFMGTINRSVVHPREIFKYAYLLSASSIICIHNHPSGDTTPSSEDIILTNALVEIGKIQNIPVLDHIIVGNNNYYSFSDNGRIGNM